MNELNCPYCGRRITGRISTCPSCGRELPRNMLSSYGADTAQPQTAWYDMPPEGAQIVPPAEEERIIEHPVTIEELKLYCRQKGMPLIKMRFFIGVNYQEPRAFGIYRDGNTFIVYKNKDNGQRAIRYSGPNEAFAVNELFQKLLDECHLRGIYLDGRPQAAELSPAEQESMRLARLEQQRKKRVKTAVFLVAIAAILILLIMYNRSRHGYYRIDNTLYYRDGGTWYIYDGGWGRYYGTPYDYDDYYLGYSY